jgi:hypothetical protein
MEKGYATWEYSITLDNIKSALKETSVGPSKCKGQDGHFIPSSEREPHFHIGSNFGHFKYEKKRKYIAHNGEFTMSKDLLIEIGDYINQWVKAIDRDVLIRTLNAIAETHDLEKYPAK